MPLLLTLLFAFAEKSLFDIPSSDHRAIVTDFMFLAKPLNDRELAHAHESSSTATAGSVAQKVRGGKGQRMGKGMGQGKG